MHCFTPQESYFTLQSYGNVFGLLQNQSRKFFLVKLIAHWLKLNIFLRDDSSIGIAAHAHLFIYSYPIRCCRIMILSGAVTCGSTSRGQHKEHAYQTSQATQVNVQVDSRLAYRLHILLTTKQPTLCFSDLALSRWTPEFLCFLDIVAHA